MHQLDGATAPTCLDNVTVFEVTTFLLKFTDVMNRQSSTQQTSHVRDAVGDNESGGPSYWIQKLSESEYRTLSWKTVCSHCLIPCRISCGPPLSCMAGSDGVWTCIECAEIVETRWKCPREYPLFRCGLVAEGAQPERYRMFANYGELSGSCTTVETTGPDSSNVTIQPAHEIPLNESDTQSNRINKMPAANSKKGNTSCTSVIDDGELIVPTKTPKQKLLELMAYMKLKDAAGKKRSENYEDTGVSSDFPPSVRLKLTYPTVETPRINGIIEQTAPGGQLADSDTRSTGVITPKAAAAAAVAALDDDKRSETYTYIGPSKDCPPSVQLADSDTHVTRLITPKAAAAAAVEALDDSDDWL